VSMTFATLWESIADSIPDTDAIVLGETRRSWGDWDERSARLSAAFTAAGLGAGSKIGLYLYNSIEYCEVQFAAFKGRGVPININYRYLDDELFYLLENSDSEALVFHTSLGERVARVMDRLPNIKLWIEVDDGGESVSGATAYEEIVSGHEPAKRIERSESDLYMLYTGGTTGMPKGVMYEIGGITRSFMATTYPLMGLAAPDAPADVGPMIRKAHQAGHQMVAIPACPMMHGTGGWVGTMMPHCAGGSVIALEGRSFDAHELWSAAQRENATQLVIVGDAFAKPMIRALGEAKDDDRAYDTSSVKLIVSSGVMWTQEVKTELLEWGDFALFDAMGSSEGTMGNQVTSRGNIGGTAKFAMSDTTKVFTEDGHEVEPGSDVAGMVAAGGNVPIGYYKDEEKSQATFRTIDGIRYSFPGDWATVEADGTLTLLGRGSQCINTAGEKVYPEEVEEALKRHSEIIDCLVVGMPDEKFGERVTAVVSRVPESNVSEADLRTFTKTQLAAFKAPKQVFVTDHVERAPNGKADYKWAKAYVTEHS
jgi:acyl-CoA synthetase (AMP-forming)/AMP-acid ligase II